jgi:hypothetical protein
MRRLVVASAILATLLTLPLGLAAALPTSAVTATDSERATAALRYLWAAQRPDGSLDGSIGETADFVIGTAAAGYDPATLQGCAGTATALDFLAMASDGAAADAAKTGKTVLAVVAAGGDPASFHGRHLLARLAAIYHSGTGAYGDGSTFSQSFAILGIEAAGGSVPAMALAELKALQDLDDSWSYGTAPVAAGQGDTNSTAIALMALNAAGDHSTDPAALAYLRTQQLADGGFPYQNSSVWPPASDPDSDAVVLQALVAAGQDPEGATWQQASNTVLTHLRSEQGTDGGFAYPGMSENAFTTSQVPAALMRAPYAAAVHRTPGRSLPAIECQGASPSPSPSAGSTASASPTVRPTAKPTARPTARPTVRPTAKPTARPTVRLTASPTDSVATAEPTEPAQTPTDGPASTATESPDATAEVAGVTSAPGASSGPTDSSPTPLLYGAAAFLGLVVVLGGGWALMARPGRR